MRVRIISPFEVDSAAGRTHYSKGQIVPNGQKNWIEKGLAVEEKPEPPPVVKPANPTNSAG